MHTIANLLLAPLYLLMRLFCRADGVHAAPRWVVHDSADLCPAVGAPTPMRVRSSRRVRRYAEAVQLTNPDPDPEPGGVAEDDASPVRAYVLVWERARAAERADACRLGTAVLPGLAGAGGVG